MSILALAPLALKVGGWLLGWAQKRADTETERLRISAGVSIAAANAAVDQHKALQETLRAANAEGTRRQDKKMNYTVFWVLITAALGPGIFNIWWIAIYNVFFWQNGIWPQSWEIAAFPPQSAVWVDMSIRWLFDPVGLGSSVGIATAAGKFAARK